MHSYSTQHAFCILLFFSPSVSYLRFQSDLRVQHSPTSPWKVEAGNGLPDTSPQDLYRMCLSAVANHLSPWKLGYSRYSPLVQDFVHEHFMNSSKLQWCWNFTPKRFQRHLFCREVEGYQREAEEDKILSRDISRPICWIIRCHRNWLHVMRYIQSLSLV